MLLEEVARLQVCAEEYSATSLFSLPSYNGGNLLVTENSCLHSTDTHVVVCSWHRHQLKVVSLYLLPVPFGAPRPGFFLRDCGISNMAESDRALQMMSKCWSLASPATPPLGYQLSHNSMSCLCSPTILRARSTISLAMTSLLTLPIHILCATTTGTYLSPVLVMAGMSMMSVTKQWP